MARVTTTEGGAQTTASYVLYLSVDLGDQPGIDDYVRNVAALNVLAETAAGFVGGRSLAPIEQRQRVIHHPTDRASPWGEVPLRVVRTSMASPWVSVLTELARTSRPLGYGAATLYALHQLLQMVMAWQRHRVDIAERKQQIKQLGQENRRHEAFGPRFGHEIPGGESEAVVNRATSVATDLGAIQAAELIPPDDPRATS